MKFFFPGTLDQVYADYNFETERFTPGRVRQQDDCYPHEMLDHAPYDGILVSRAVLNPVQSNGRCAESTWLRFTREGARSFLHLRDSKYDQVAIMGDCGAYTYVNEPYPTLSVEDAIHFHLNAEAQYGLSVDHMIPGYVSTAKYRKRARPPKEWQHRVEISLDLAEHFLSECRRQSVSFEPIGVAQGWDPATYARSVVALQDMGYKYVALGGMARLLTDQILAVLEAVHEIRRPDTRVHLLGVSRLQHLDQMKRWGVASFDSSMPLRQAFLNEKFNYHTLDRHYLAIRVPQVSGNRQLIRRIVQMDLDSGRAFDLERACMRVLREFETGRCSSQLVLDTVCAYEELLGMDNRRNAYIELLEDTPWRHCTCRLCRETGIHIVIFRGKQRNNRRGFHNLQVFYQLLNDQARSSSSALA